VELIIGELFKTTSKGDSKKKRQQVKAVNLSPE
jgi:hypothetical protein